MENMSILKEFREYCGPLVEGDIIDRDYGELIIDGYMTSKEREERLQELRKIKLP